MKSGRKEFLGERSNGAIRKSFTLAVARQYSGIRPIAPGIRRTTSQRNRQRALSGRRRSLHPDKDFILLLHEVYSEKTVEAMLSVSDFSIWEHLDLELRAQELARWPPSVSG